MTRTKIYTITFARLVLLLIGFLLYLPAVIAYALSQLIHLVSNGYMKSLFAFYTDSKALINRFGHELDKANR